MGFGMYEEIKFSIVYFLKKKTGIADSYYNIRAVATIMRVVRFFSSEMLEFTKYEIDVRVMLYKHAYV